MNIVKSGKSWRTFLPLEGIKLERALREVAIGNFKLSRLKYENAPELLADDAKPSFHNLCLSHRIDGAVAQPPYCEACPKRNSKSHQKNCVCVVIGTSNKVVRSCDVSLAVLQDATALLRFYMYVHSQGAWPVMNLIDSRRLPSYGYIPAVSSNSETEIFSFEPGLRAYEMRIYGDAIEQWKEMGFEKALQVIEAAHLGMPLPELDEIIVSALIWCGEMLAEREIKECFLRGATSLETISTPVAGRGQISKNFRTFGATLVALGAVPGILDPNETPDAEAIKLFKESADLFKDAYKTRSHISHGSSGIAFDRDSEMWRSQQTFVRACLGAITLWFAYPEKVEFYNNLEATFRKLNSIAPIN